AVDQDPAVRVAADLDDVVLGIAEDRQQRRRRGEQGGDRGDGPALEGLESQAPRRRSIPTQQPDAPLAAAGSPTAPILRHADAPWYVRPGARGIRARGAEASPRRPPPDGIERTCSRSSRGGARSGGGGLGSSRSLMLIPGPSADRRRTSLRPRWEPGLRPS